MNNEEYEEEIFDPELSEEEQIDDIVIGEPEELTEDQIKDKELEHSNPVREIRTALKEAKRREKELQRELESLRAPITNTHIPDIVEKPTLESVGYDPEEYEQALLTWKEVQDRQLYQQQLAMQQMQQEQQHWGQLTNKYEQEKQSLKLSDYKEAEDEVVDTFEPFRQGLILQYSKEPAKLIYALGKNKARLDELSRISDPIAFALAINDIERNMKVKKSSTPAPEKRLNTGIGAGLGNVQADARLDKLREEAQRTGDFTKVVAYKRSMKK